MMKVELHLRNIEREISAIRTSRHETVILRTRDLWTKELTIPAGTRYLRVPWPASPKEMKATFAQTFGQIPPTYCERTFTRTQEAANGKSIFQEV